MDPTTLLAEPLEASRCPLSGDLMDDPVVTADGHSYQRAALVAHLSARGAGEPATSPLTGLRLARGGRFVENHALRDACAALRAMDAECAASPFAPASPRITSP